MMEKNSKDKTWFVLSRRELFEAAALAAFSTTVLGDVLASTEENQEVNRLETAFQLRLKAAKYQQNLPVVEHRTNGDEDSLPRRISCFTKGFPHDGQGYVNKKAYDAYLHAIRSGKPEDFERIPLGGYSKLANPQAAFAYDLIGPDASQTEMAPPPRYSSAEQASELIELYWHSLCRDVPFAEYSTSSIVKLAAEDLSGWESFSGSREAGNVTPATVFRGPTSGDLVGPYISQFMAKTIPLSPIRADQKIRTPVPGLEYITGYDEWLRIQNGYLAGVNQFDQQKRYIRNGRDLGEYVHRDFTYQAFICAALMLFNMGTPTDGGNPYKHSRTQSGFVTFGPSLVWFLIAIAAQISLKATWFHKWIIHRRVRPEEFAGQVHNQMTGAGKYPIYEGLFRSPVLEESHDRYGTYLLPMAYPEGCPMHPSYPAGHAVIAGACATVLKACFDESFVVPDPVVAASDGLSLISYEGPPLSVGDELDKLASNIAIGRDFAGVHWRSDSIEGMKLGEAVAIRILEEMHLTGNELFAGYSLRKFDGNRITIGKSS